MEPMESDELVETLARKGAKLDEIEMVISSLKTKENFDKMMKLLEKVEHPSREFLIVKTILIADRNI